MAGDQLARILDAGAAFHPAFAQFAALRDQPHEQPDPQGHADDAGSVADGRSGDQRPAPRADQPPPGLRSADLPPESRDAEAATPQIGPDSGDPPHPHPSPPPTIPNHAAALPQPP